MIDRNHHEGETLMIESLGGLDASPPGRLRAVWLEIEKLLIAWGHWLDGRARPGSDDEPDTDETA